MSSLPAITGQHFAYAAGRSSVLQQLLLSQTDIDRLLGAPNLQDAEKMLNEFKMTNVIHQGIKGAGNILHALNAWVRTETLQMVPEVKQPIFNILWLPEDGALLAYLLKQHHGLTSNVSQKPDVSMTAYAPEELEKLVETGKAETLPTQLVEFVQMMREKESLMPEAIDAAVAQYIATAQIKLARTSGSSEIKKYVQNEIDMTNIRTALRLLQREEKNADQILEGGSMKTDVFLKDLHAIIAEIIRSPLPYSLAEEVQQNAQNPHELQQAFSKITAANIAQMWNMALSIEPVFAFAALTLSHIRVLRVLLIGKASGFSPQEIKKILPPFIPASNYVL